MMSHLTAGTRNLLSNRTTPPASSEYLYSSDKLMKESTFRDDDNDAVELGLVLPLGLYTLLFIQFVSSAISVLVTTG